MGGFYGLSIILISLDKADVKYGFLFGLTKVDEFDGFKNPREEIYDFNVAHM